MKNRRKVGGFYERRAAGYLQSQGLKILEMNYRSKRGELDLIARDGKYVVFIEVKYRFTMENGSAAEAVDHKKQRIISRMADFYLMRHYRTTDVPCRFDVVAFDGEDVRWYKNAFEYCP